MPSAIITGLYPDAVYTVEVRTLSSVGLPPSEPAVLTLRLPDAAGATGGSNAGTPGGSGVGDLVKALQAVTLDDGWECVPKSGYPVCSAGAAGLCQPISCEEMVSSCCTCCSVLACVCMHQPAHQLEQADTEAARPRAAAGALGPLLRAVLACPRLVRPPRDSALCRRLRRLHLRHARLQRRWQHCASSAVLLCLWCGPVLCWQRWRGGGQRCGRVLRRHPMRREAALTASLACAALHSLFPAASLQFG